MHFFVLTRNYIFINMYILDLIMTNCLATEHIETKNNSYPILQTSQSDTTKMIPLSSFRDLK
jgi:hypothetical protein